MPIVHRRIFVIGLDNSLGRKDASFRLLGRLRNPPFLHVVATDNGGDDVVVVVDDDDYVDLTTLHDGRWQSV